MLKWIVSSFCADHACVEVAATDESVFVRDGKHRDGPHLSFSRADWNSFLEAITHGDVAVE